PWNSASEESKAELFSREGGYTRSVVVLNFTTIGIINDNGKKFSDEDNEILKRFGNVFEQAYTRFLDLQKAEAQAREAQIEAALEKVRSRSMGMQKSEELRDVIQVIYEQLLQLNFEISNAGFLVDYRQSGDSSIWMTDATTEFPTQQYLPRFDHPFNDDYVEQKDNGQKLFTKVYPFEEKNTWWKVILKHLPAVTAETRKALLSSPGLALSRVLMKHIGLYLLNYTGTPYTTAENKILIRFGNVFEQTYTRFLDLQKAEAQAREAQIEAGLERVRSRAMGMQNSEELNALIGTVFSELTKLDLALTRCVIWIIDPQTNGATWWMANSEDLQNPINCDLPFNEYEPYMVFLEQWKNKAVKFQYELKGEIKKDWDEYLFSKTGLSRLPDFVITGMKAPERVLLTASFNNFGAVNAASLEPLSDEHADILLRFAKVFDLTYTRFNDLKQAEAAAKEARIEASLEKVRGKAMAMQNSNDLSVAASSVFTELRKLGINPIRCGVGLLNKESRRGQLYSATSSAGGDGLSVVGWVELSGHPVLESIYDTWLRNEEYYPELIGEQLKLYYESLLAGLPVPVPDWQKGQKQYGNFFPFTVGCLYAWSAIPYNEDEIKILKRFASIIDLTFRRYLELQTLEANAKEAVKQAALDRIRADIASMRTISDLDRITPL
ncbi:MAG TPA: hypothetical protein VLS85_08540, partial [Hanamia sp.]|nr:hypothetical protein [Hanamia sp.]